eukprot:4506125-Prymnesium_polylepis.1
MLTCGGGGFLDARGLVRWVMTSDAPMNHGTCHMRYTQRRRPIRGELQGGSAGLRKLQSGLGRRSQEC